MKEMPKIVLASKSARRREILEHLGIKFRTLVSDADEDIDTSFSPGKYTELLSKRKAEEVTPYVSADELIIASDTVVYAKGEILGKPRDRDDAIRMLELLSADTHQVVSGLAVMYSGKIALSHETTFVTFRELDASEIEGYVDSGEPYDKAGGYGIQDSASVCIEKIDGDYFNVVGLPVFRLFDTLKKEFGLNYFELRG